ncbi:MAG: HAMP domain-containing histidine kinase [Clostridia bacterium]|nr:HAMP domain-containing histidine kinase [Clostridia bacterium]
MSHRKKGFGISIRWKLAVFLAVFVAIVLIVTWVFQVYLLNAFHELIKKNELQKSAQELAQFVQSEELPMRAYSYALNGTMSVGVYHIEEESAVTLVSVDATGQSGIPLGERMLSKFYRLAQENGGSYLGQFTFGGYEVNKESGFFPFENGAHATDYISPKDIRLIYVQVEKGDGDDSYLIILDTGLQPLDSTVQTLRTQFLWIAVILLFCAGVMVFMLYRHISAPLVRMNESAKQLALGRYDTVFLGDGYLETRELASTLNYASHELSKLDALQKELIANISHDLRTPLTMIKGYGEIMRDIPGENTPENMQIVIDETTRLSELVNDLLDLSKIQTGTRKAEKACFDLTAALEETMNRYDTFVRHQGYQIRVETDQHVWVCADRSMILQVLYNLINNAINYTGEDQRVTVVQNVFEGYVRISVTDTGDGIAEEQIPLIWDRYYKVDRVHRRAVIGTGLGLSIVKEILELHNAAYGVNSKLGEGSTFWFDLPIVPTPEQLPDETDREV